ncbi:hypothetical protein M422DRAFT_35191 [Sphaerobolus stellatus SS14]|uniref:Pre-mRNA-splicing factor CWC24 n=1 Tax=Sphaerobolus stellatus (strain SS14) TaxID=990650 RepID=A0A0C9TV53_SPHS4|nr:hypothetical protein M422DRAFT_35191 [Sphaerobolus stellatus SS14]
MLCYRICLASPPTSPPATTSMFKVANESNTASAVIVPNHKTTSNHLSQATNKHEETMKMSGFGDTCKFSYDRGTHLTGWQLDKLAADSKGNVANDVESDIDSDEDIPFVCLICRKPCTDPVVTGCGHYFCSSWIFNRADKIIAKMNEKRKSKEMAEEEESTQGGVEVEGLTDADSEDNDDY